MLVIPWNLTLEAGSLLMHVLLTLGLLSALPLLLSELLTQRLGLGCWDLTLLLISAALLKIPPKYT